MNHAARRSAAAVAAALFATGCHTMLPTTIGEVGTARPGQVWVTRSNDSVVVVATPKVFGDTLMGYIEGQFEELPASDLKHLQVKRIAKGRTAALVTAGVIGTATTLYLISGAGDYEDPAATLDCDDDPELPGCPGAVPGL